MPTGQFPMAVPATPHLTAFPGHKGGPNQSARELALPCRGRSTKEWQELGINVQLPPLSWMDASALLFSAHSNNLSPVTLFAGSFPPFHFLNNLQELPGVMAQMNSLQLKS